MIWEILDQLKRKMQGLSWNQLFEEDKIDDVVLIKNPIKPRPYWQLGRVVKLFHGEDNKIHSINVKGGNGLTQNHLIKHLYPLELTLTHDYHLSPESDNLNSIKQLFNLHHAQNERRIQEKDDEYTYY